jgi:uncharacterized membrane protein YgcG
MTGAVYEDPDTTKRLSGVTVKLNTGATDVTDANGIYAFTVPAGTYTATATRSGFVTGSQTRAVTAGATIWGSIGLKKSVVPTDLDGDGVVDTADNCEQVPNANQLNTDGDADGDACDGDDDNDGKFDEDDNCPLVPNADQADANNNDIGDACESSGAGGGAGGSGGTGGSGGSGGAGGSGGGSTSTAPDPNGPSNTDPPEQSPSAANDPGADAGCAAAPGMPLLLLLGLALRRRRAAR